MTTESQGSIRLCFECNIGGLENDGSSGSRHRLMGLSLDKEEEVEKKRIMWEISRRIIVLDLIPSIKLICA